MSPKPDAKTPRKKGTTAKKRPGRPRKSSIGPKADLFEELSQRKESMGRSPKAQPVPTAPELPLPSATPQTGPPPTSS